ncbi:MAG: hypothetical protein ACE5G0_05855 [Rhodothermales bacterium]
MIGKSISAGLRGIRRRPGLVVLLYGVNLALALILTVPVYITLGNTVGLSGFSPDLARDFDLALWADIIEDAGSMLRALQFQLLWMIPVYLIWKAAADVGLIHALRGDGIRSFWQGVGRYTGKAVLVGLIYLVVVGAGILGIVLLIGGLSAIWPGEVGLFWINVVLAPLLLIGGLAVLDLMRDYANNALVISEQGVFQAVLTGAGWPFRHARAGWLYLAWFVPAALLLALPTLLDMNTLAATGGTIWLLFLLQQGGLLLRAAVTVGWIGSEVAFYESVRLQEAPRIASDMEADAATFDPALGTEPTGLASA